MLSPDERIGPRPRRRLGSALTGSLIALVAIAAATTLLDDRIWSPLASMTRDWTQPTATVGPDGGQVTPSALAELPTHTIRDEPAQPQIPSMSVDEVPRHPATFDTPQAAETATTPPERLPPPPVDTSDPLQVKAMAVGLHPELSHVLLGKLTAVDLKNAATAIKRALAETPENEDYTFPRTAAADLAVFHVRFVPGAPTDCRRYVVTVTKERWAYTALPMESCGSAGPARPAPPRKG